MCKIHAYFRNTSIPNIVSCKNMRTIMLGLMSLKASMTTLPFTDWMGSTTTATALKSDWKWPNSSVEGDIVVKPQPVWKSLKALLGVDVNSWQPAAKARVRVVPDEVCVNKSKSAITSHFNLPANNHLWPSSLFQHVQHFCLRTAISRYEQLESLDYCYYNINLENGINCFNGNSGSRLGHGKHIDYPHWKRQLSRTRQQFTGGYNWQISTSPVYSSTNSPSMRPMTSMGTPARPCFDIFSRAREEM